MTATTTSLAENGWDDADSGLGRSLWDFVAGHELEKLQRMLLRLAGRSPLLGPIARGRAARGSSAAARSISMCGWCDRFLVDGEWIEAEKAAARLGLFALPELPSISHGVCPVCGELLLAA